MSKRFEVRRRRTWGIVSVGPPPKHQAVASAGTFGEQRARTRTQHQKGGELSRGHVALWRVRSSMTQPEGRGSRRADQRGSVETANRRRHRASRRGCRRALNFVEMATTCWRRQRRLPVLNLPAAQHFRGGWTQPGLSSFPSPSLLTRRRTAGRAVQSLRGASIPSGLDDGASH
jgi:hypothetical protein